MSGLLLLNKPEGTTSFGAVARVKKITGVRRVGHTGTLDPMATGVLPILIGRATVLSRFLIDADKSYFATIRLGIETDTCDITGKIVSRHSVDGNIDLDPVLEKFKGKQMQIPPMFSAIKQGGVRMYELARRGETAEIPAREIEIFSLIRTSDLNDRNEFCIETSVSKGTYIRSLCRDIGKSLGCGAALTRLCRTETAGFGIDRCVSLDSLTPENINDYILPCDSAVAHMPKINISEKQSVRFRNGGSLSLDRIEEDGFCDGMYYRVYFGEKFLGLGLADFQGRILKMACLIDINR